MIRNTLKQTKFKDKTVKSTLTLVKGLHGFPDFPDRARMRGSGNICSVSVFFVRVGSQISPPPGEQDQLNALPQRQQRQSNPHPMPCPPPRRLNIDRCISEFSTFLKINKTREQFLLRLTLFYPIYG